MSSIGGLAYADSLNVGMTDLVAALRWVRHNIANFGGDPNCVMIYGQSGGGSKATTMLGMPSAEGLIHRASAQSGGGGNPPSGEQSREFAKRVIAELGVKDIAELQKMEWAKLNEKGNSMSSRPTEAEWLATLTQSYGEVKATALVAALKKAHPEGEVRKILLT